MGGRGGDDRDEDFGNNVFEDQDTRDFYESIPDLFEMVPSVLLGEDAMARRAKALEEAAAAAEAEGGGGGEEEEGNGDGAAQDDEAKKRKEEEEAEKRKAADEAAAAALRAKEAAEEEAAEKRAAAADGEEGEVEEEDPNAVERAKFDEFVAHLYTCQVQANSHTRNPNHEPRSPNSNSRTTIPYPRESAPNLTSSWRTLRVPEPGSDRQGISSHFI